MAKSRRESPLQEAEVPHFIRNKLHNLKGFAEGRKTMPGPGKKGLSSYLLALDGRGLR